MLIEFIRRNHETGPRLANLAPCRRIQPDEVHLATFDWSASYRHCHSLVSNSLDVGASNKLVLTSGTHDLCGFRPPSSRPTGGADDQAPTFGLQFDFVWQIRLLQQHLRHADAFGICRFWMRCGRGLPCDYSVITWTSLARPQVQQCQRRRPFTGSHVRSRIRTFRNMTVPAAYLKRNRAARETRVLGVDHRAAVQRHPKPSAVGRDLQRFHWPPV